MIHTFERSRIDPHRLYGVVVSESDTLVLIHQISDFRFDGYTVIRRRDITKSFSSDSDAYGERLMKKERLWKQPSKVARSLPVMNWHELLSALKGKPVQIENERRDVFLIGPIVACDARSVSVHYFDGVGEWRDIERISLREITAVTFGNFYSVVHYRNLPRRPKS